MVKNKMTLRQKRMTKKPTALEIAKKHINRARRKIIMKRKSNGKK